MKKPDITGDRKAVLAKLETLADERFTEDDILHEGHKIVLPTDMSDERAVVVIEENIKQKQTVTEFSRTYQYRPWDGAAAFERAMRFLTGTVGIQSAIASFFGDILPERKSIPISATETMDVPWGKVNIALFDAEAYLGNQVHPELGQLFHLTIHAARKYRAQIESFFNIIQLELEERSIYRGKAFDGQNNPEFLDLRGVDPNQVIYSDDVMEQLEANVWSLLEHTQLMRDVGLPLKRAVLLEGPFGCIYGDAEMVVNRGGKSFRISLQELVYKLGGGLSNGRAWDESIPTTVQRRSDDGSVRLVEIANGWESGIKTTYTVTTATGHTIRATDEHPFLTTEGWKRLDELEAGRSMVYLNDGQSSNGRGGNVLEQTAASLVVSVKLFGDEMTYDIEVLDEPRCFIADGFVVHNTGKTLGIYVTAIKAIAEGWTVVYCRPGKDDPLAVIQTARLYQPAIVAIEDVDTMADATLPGDARDRVTQVLDVFDGINAKGTELGILLTTNHVEKIYKGMMRPGRLDAVIHIGPLDANGVGRMIEAVVPANERAEGLDYQAIWEAMEGFMPAFVKESIDRARRYAIVRTGDAGSVLDTPDFVLAGKGLRPQLEMMEGAAEGTHLPTLDAAMQHQVRTVVVDTIDHARLIEDDGDGGPGAFKLEVMSDNSQN